MFVDVAKIFIKAGDGGDGAVAFHREKYVASGGPDGGDGGRGGNIVFLADTNISTLADFRYKRKYKAPKGENGKGDRRRGKNAEDLIVRVPMGTLVKDANTGRIMADISTNEPVIVAKGGKGGWGNSHFATPVRQTPRFAKPGLPGEEFEVTLELKLLADVGLVGFPNVGKSTLLSRVTNARPKIANYHFTTLNPNLGVVDLNDAKGFVIADIPGLIEGASEGVGLGHEFLRHIERTKVIIHMVDAASTEGRNPVADIKAINHELYAYNPELLSRPQVIAANKIDVLNAMDGTDPIKELKEAFEKDGIKVFPISAVTGQGLKELLYHVSSLLSNMDSTPVTFEKELDVDTLFDNPNEAFYVEKSNDGIYLVYGPRVDRMLGYTNLESEKGFNFFQRFLRETGILKELKSLGVQEGDTVRVGEYLEFDYYD